MEITEENNLLKEEVSSFKTKEEKIKQKKDVEHKQLKKMLEQKADDREAAIYHLHFAKKIINKELIQSFAPQDQASYKSFVDFL